MDRKLWQQSLSTYRCPPWPCPKCRKGTVSIVQKSLVHHKTAESPWADDENWMSAAMSVAYAFTAWGECNHQSCKQHFAIAGVGGVAPGDDPEGGVELQDYFSPRFCDPMPDIIELPTNCPAEVANELRSAFSIFWLHKAACAGRIRVALELLMNHLGVPKQTRLHARLDAFAKNEPAVGSHLIALKWLGNTGSHDSEVSSSDLLDAFEILENALTEVIERRSARIATLAEKLTKKHGR